MAAALAVVLAFRSLGEFGVSRALERYERDPREIAPAVMTISVVAGAALAAVCFLAPRHWRTARARRPRPR